MLKRCQLRIGIKRYTNVLIYFISESIVNEPITVEVKVAGKEKGTRRRTV